MKRVISINSDRNVDLFPLKLHWLLRLPLRGGRNLSDMLWRYNNQALSRYEPLNLVKQGIPDSVPIKVTEILPRLKDGGAFVKFQHEEGITVQEIDGTNVSRMGSVTTLANGACN